jgi:HD superfamily phosphohydrolase
MKCARVCEVTEVDAKEGNNNSSSSVLRICFEKKEVWNVYELFHTRFSLHKRAYQHRVSTVVEHMFSEVDMFNWICLYFRKAVKK